MAYGNKGKSSMKTAKNMTYSGNSATATNMTYTGMGNTMPESRASYHSLSAGKRTKRSA